MSIFSRMQRIAKANINELLAKAENPEKILKQRVRELEETIQEAKAAAANFAVSFKKMEKDQEQMKRLRAEWEQKAERSISDGDEEMARKAVAEKIKADERLKSLAPNVRQSHETFAKLKDSLSDLQDQLAAARLRLTELTSRKRAADAQKAFSKHVDKVAAVSSDETEFTRMEEKVAQAESEVEIDRDLRSAAEDIEATVERKSRDLQVETELEEMKKRMKK